MKLKDKAQFFIAEFCQFPVVQCTGINPVKQDLTVAG